MDKSEGMITENYGDYKVEKMLFTYDEKEQEEIKLAKKVYEQELGKLEYFTFYQIQLENGMNESQAILYNFIDGYTKTDRDFFYSNDTIGEKLKRGKDKINDTIKELVKQGYITLKKRIKAGGGTNRFIRTTGKGTPELLIRKNRIGYFGKTELDKSENPTRVIYNNNIIYNNYENQNLENQNQEQSQDTNVSIPKQNNITPNLTNGDLTFENIYKLFYHKSGHKPSIDKCRKVFDSLKLDTEGYNMLVKDLNLFRIEYKYGIKDQMYRPGFEKYVGGFNAEGVNEEYRLRTIIKFHMENREDIEKMKKRYKDLCDTFGKDIIDKLVKEYGRAKNKITLNIN